MATNSELKSFEFSKGAPTSAKRKGNLEAQPVQADAAKLFSTSTEQTPEVSNETEVKEASPVSKWNESELAAIFDDLMFQGEYSENIRVKDKLLVTFRTRSSDESEEIAITLDTLGANLFTTLDQKRSLLNLQYSLTRYHNRDLTTLSKEDKAKFIGKLPTPVIVALITELAKFDEKVYAALKEGEESF